MSTVHMDLPRNASPASMQAADAPDWARPDWARIVRAGLIGGFTVPLALIVKQRLAPEAMG